jgi:hypothetical protein
MMGNTMGERMSRDPVPVGSFLETAFPTLAERLLEARIRREWEALVGPEIARRCQPRELKGGTLNVIVNNSPWLQELTLREADLLSRLAHRYGPRAVRSLTLSLGTLPAEPADPVRRGARSNARPSDAYPTEEERKLIEAAVALIADPELRLQVRRLLEKACASGRVRTGTA